ncbi:MAG: amidohydrolase family protein [Betaproteobacteria bacterium]|nr:amidohydrolase family protein [Betaproteobacteria bacterium]
MKREAGRIAFHNASLFDSHSGALRRNATIVVEGWRIAHVSLRPLKVAGARAYDLKGKTLLPGLIDCHVHVTAVHHDVLWLSMQPPSLITAQAKDVLAGMLARGFTTVRDAGGADFGLQEAVERGIFDGPRLFIAGRPLTQTGGHGDGRPKGARTMFCTCAGLGLFGAVADGVTEVRRAAREQLRNGANHIKVMAGGGVMSPTDPIQGTQYSVDELRAVCEEAEAANTYVMAHAYSPRAIERAVRAGVRSIEHGNLLDEKSARAMKECGATLVPTLATYAALDAEASNLKLPSNQLEKLNRVQQQGVTAIQIAKAAGVAIAFGTDLLGSMHASQSTEFGLRLPAMKPSEILRSATSVAADLIGQAGKLGVIAAGAAADLLVVAGDPTKDLAPLQAPEKGLLAVMKGGIFFKNRL